MVILGMAAIIAPVGWAFLESHTTAMPEAHNRMAAIRAQYVAESGMEIAEHFLMYPPTTVTPGNYWTGDNAISIDPTPDYTNVNIVQDADVPLKYTVTSVGIAYGVDGEVRAKRQIRAELLVPPRNVTWYFPQAMLQRSSVTVPSSVALFGDLHANGNLLGHGWSIFRVSATGIAIWIGSGPPSDVQSNAPASELPATNIAQYTTYQIGSATYAAYNWNKDNVNKNDAASLNAIDMSDTNPGRIIQTKDGNFTISEDVDLNGCLLVNGDLTVDGVNVRVTAVEGFPALVINGNLKFNKDDAVVTINGPVICSGYLDGNNKRRMDVRVNGPFIANRFRNAAGTDTIFRFNDSADYATFHNFESTADPLPVTYLSWEES